MLTVRPLLGLAGSLLMHVGVVGLLASRDSKPAPQPPHEEPLFVEFGYGELPASALSEEALPGLPMPSAVPEVPRVVLRVRPRVKRVDPVPPVAVPSPVEASAVVPEAVDEGPPPALPHPEVPLGLGARVLGPTASLGPGRNLLPLVQARIDSVARLLAPSTHRAAGGNGVAVIELTVNGAGYVSGRRVIQRYGDPLDTADIDAILHFAEPFPHWDGQLEVEVHW